MTVLESILNLMVGKWYYLDLGPTYQCIYLESDDPSIMYRHVIEFCTANVTIMYYGDIDFFYRVFSMEELCLFAPLEDDELLKALNRKMLKKKLLK